MPAETCQAHRKSLFYRVGRQDRAWIRPLEEVLLLTESWAIGLGCQDDSQRIDYRKPEASHWQATRIFLLFPHFAIHFATKVFAHEPV